MCDVKLNGEGAVARRCAGIGDNFGLWPKDTNLRERAAAESFVIEIVDMVV